MALKIQILDQRSIRHNTLIASARVHIEDFGIVINDVKLFVKGESHWAQFPNKVYEKDGKKNYFSYIHFLDKEVEKEVLSTVANLMLKEYETGNLGANYAV